MFGSSLVPFIGLVITLVSFRHASGGGKYFVATGAVFFGGLSLARKAFVYFVHVKADIDTAIFVDRWPAQQALPVVSPIPPKPPTARPTTQPQQSKAPSSNSRPTFTSKQHKAPAKKSTWLRVIFGFIPFIFFVIVARNLFHLPTTVIIAALFIWTFLVAQVVFNE